MKLSKGWFHIQETLQSIRQHKMRNLAAGFGMAWGIFVLSVLLSGGHGLQAGVMRIFSGYGQNTLWIYGGQKSTIAEGRVQGHPILFDKQLMQKIRNRFTGQIDALSEEINHRGSTLVSYDAESLLVSLKGVGNDYFEVKQLNLDAGRTFNALDLRQSRLVCIIGQQVKETLFDEQDAIGQHLQYMGNWFQVVGVLANGSMFNQNEQQTMLIPSTSYQKTFANADNFHVFGIKLSDHSSVAGFENLLTKYLARELGFEENDKKSLFILNFSEQVKAFDKLFNGLNIFLWIIGGCLLLSGIVGVTNMMMVIVNERTSEIGIRKAVGANDKEILAMVLIESIVVTLLSGLAGLLSSFLVVLGANEVLQSWGAGKDTIMDTLQMDFSIVIGAVTVLILCGAVSGLFPAQRAIQIMPINALNSDQ